jgi:hypothetical protein
MPADVPAAGANRETAMRFALLVVAWCLLLLLCWPLAVLVAVLFPILWLIALPFRLAYALTEAAFALIRALLFLPARVLGLRRRV